MPAPVPIVRRTLFTGELMAIAHVAARPASTAKIVTARFAAAS